MTGLPSVWCVFQRLPGERCPSLAAICATRAVADELVRGSEDDDRQQGRSASIWTVEQWSVLAAELKAIGDIQQISDVMDNMREGVLPDDADAASEEVADDASEGSSEDPAAATPSSADADDPPSAGEAQGRPS